MDKETYTFEDRMYVNPTTSRDEQLQFVDNLRAIQAEDAARIARDTHNLGTDVTSNLGGLNGAEGVWARQYANPQVDSMVATLRATAQAQALTDILKNYQNQLQNRYRQAYRKYNRLKGNTGTTGTTGSNSGLTINTLNNGSYGGNGDLTLDYVGTISSDDPDYKSTTEEMMKFNEENNFNLK